MNGCCDEYGCKRRQPILIRQGGLTSRWYAVVRYTQMADRPDTVRSAMNGKHDIHGQIQPLLNQAYEAGYRAGSRSGDLS